MPLLDPAKPMSPSVPNACLYFFFLGFTGESRGQLSVQVLFRADAQSGSGQGQTGTFPCLFRLGQAQQSSVELSFLEILSPLTL